MGFQQGLSGLNASSRNLDVIGNNIANANTVGMKASRAEFGELVASSLGTGGGQAVGIGVEVAVVSQQFTQGNVTVTGNDLDVAINGAGFLQLQMPDGSTAYTRDGQLKLDKVGNIITNTGAKVMGYPTTVAGVATSFSTQPIVLPTSAPVGASATANISAELNLDARLPIASSTTPVTPVTTYGTSITAYDTQGSPITVPIYLTKTANDTWDAYTLDAPAVAGDPGTTPIVGTSTPIATLTFDVTGALTSATTVPINVYSPNATIGTFAATLDLSKVTQYATNFAVSNMTQDGYPPGELTGVKIQENGVIMARYSNGQTQAAGQVALANFRNVQGLNATGGGNWIETNSSGQPVMGAPAQGKFGTLRSGALEESNVDLTAELVNMMTAQRAYQANAQTIKTQDQVMQTLVNMR